MDGCSSPELDNGEPDASQTGGLSEENVYLPGNIRSHNPRFRAINDASARSEPPSGTADASSIVSLWWYGRQTGRPGRCFLGDASISGGFLSPVVAAKGRIHFRRTAAGYSGTRGVGGGSPGRAKRKPCKKSARCLFNHAHSSGRSTPSAMIRTSSSRASRIRLLAMMAL